MRNEATAVALTSSLRSLRGSRPLYMLPTAPLAEGALVPCFKAADRVDCMAGFFSSEVLAALAPGLAAYIASSDNSFRLIISPLLKPEDQAAIEEGIQPPERVAAQLLGELTLTGALIAKATGAEVDVWAVTLLTAESPSGIFGGARRSLGCPWHGRELGATWHTAHWSRHHEQD